MYLCWRFLLLARIYESSSPKKKKYDSKSMTCILVLESFKPLLNTNILEFNFDLTIVSDEKSCVTKLITVPPEINMELLSGGYPGNRYLPVGPMHVFC